MKLIIDIPEEIYHEAITSGYSYQYDEIVANAVADGIPLDDVKTEIQDIYVGYRHGYEIMADVLRILDNIGKAESEE